MGDSEGPKPKIIPSWQLQGSSAQTLSEEDAAQNSTDRTSTHERQHFLRDSAAKFLQDEDVRDAPVERKKSFLGTKGLSEDEIQDLLQEQGQEPEQHTAEAAVMEDYGIEKEALRRQSSKPVPTQVNESHPSAILANNASSESTSASGGDQTPSKDIPPIITYPEFLLHSQKPPPLMTARRLLIALYVSSGVAATASGTSKYIVEPMIESLTSARRSLAETASANIDALNSKLEGTVSKLPDNLVNVHGEEDSDNESIDSDPSRFFSRSAGTQTSPHGSLSPSLASSKVATLATPSQGHNDTLSTIHSRLSDLRPPDTTSAVKESMNELRKFLDGLPYANTTQQNGKLWEKTNSDEYGKLRAEIRGVKGVLLSARNFPSGVSVR